MNQRSSSSIKTKARPMVTPKAINDGFFLPDLCAIHSVFLLIIAAQLFAVVLTLASSSIVAFDWLQLALTSLYVQWIALTSAGLLCALRPYLRQLRPETSVFVSYLIIPLNAWVMSWCSRAVTAVNELPFVFDAEIMTHVLIAAIIGGMVIRYFYMQAQLVARKQAALESQIQALQSRIRPHFLFNCMNSIASLIAVDPERAEQVVEDLSRLFRASLHDAGNQVAYAEERDLCKRYLSIEKIRLGDRLHVSWHERGLPNTLTIPLLTLQPLLENAILHGIQPSIDGGVIEIQAQYHLGLFELKITNPLTQGAVKEAHDGNRIALNNIRHRLNALYGERAKLTSYPDGGQYVTHLTYPVKADASKKPAAKER